MTRYVLIYLYGEPANWRAVFETFSSRARGEHYAERFLISRGYPYQVLQADGLPEPVDQSKEGK